MGWALTARWEVESEPRSQVLVDKEEWEVREPTCQAGGVGTALRGHSPRLAQVFWDDIMKDFGWPGTPPAGTGGGR